ncbi:MAG: hypothetical protein ACXW1S_08050 [Acidimicrobiia bacterium]
MTERLQQMYRDLELCTRCGELRGAVEWTDGRSRRRLVQECACQRALRLDAPARWWGFDFNVVAELCRVCGTEVVRSGTRLSDHVCDDCRVHRLQLRAHQRLEDQRLEDQRLEEWSREALFRNLVDAGLTHRSIVPIADYLEVVRQVDRARRVAECITFLHLGTVTT